MSAPTAQQDSGDLWQEITNHIHASTGSRVDFQSRQPIHGGCINETWCLGASDDVYFVKVSGADRLPMLTAEADGLVELISSNAIRVPKPVCWGAASYRSYLVLEYIEFSSGSNPVVFAQELAALHQITASRFGWKRDNTIGSTPQINTWSDNWVDFWRNHRLGYQLELAGRSSHQGSLLVKGERLLAEFPPLFSDYRPQPSLLHGDLWSGNWGLDDDHNPVIFDPAVYYGDRETDLAMTELFGDPGAGFYAAYNDMLPLDPGYGVRKIFYNVYHLLNHMNLFGGGYSRQAERAIDAVLGELR
ncbi:MAG: fructosamine kinase family protein [Gammaproteobacteria bacterium]